jgi:ribosomal protein L3 glutamine methyltransferase
MKLIQSQDCSDFHTIKDFYRYALSKAYEANLYYGHGTDNPEDDLLWLVLASLNLPLTTDASLLDARLTAAEKQHLCAQLTKRIDDRIPVAYLINKAWFCGLPFYVDEHVLIPRSPIAELIEQHFAPWVDPFEVDNILDLCTGSGCIAIALAYAFPDACVTGVDISEEALHVAIRNRKEHHLESQVNFFQSDVWSEIPSERFNLIVSNPPYVSDEEMETLPIEYRHEPDMALRANEKGLAIVEQILQQAKHYLTEKGILVVEVGNSEPILIEKYPHVPFTWLEFERGGQGIFLLTAEQLNQYF